MTLHKYKLLLVLLIACWRQTQATPTSHGSNGYFRNVSLDAIGDKAHIALHNVRATTEDELQQALGIAKEIISSYCHISDYRVQIRLETMSSPTIVMSASAPQIGVHTSHPKLNNLRRFAYVYVPTSLARQWEVQDDLGPNGASILQNIDADVIITVNKQKRFGLYDSECQIHGDADRYSLISVFLHELLHGMGFVSNVADPEIISMFDGLLTKRDWTNAESWVFDANGKISGNHDNDLELLRTLKAVRIAGFPVYNPHRFRHGSSFHHLGVDVDSIMTPNTSPGGCAFALGLADIAVLRSFGWNCSDEPRYSVEWNADTVQLDTIRGNSFPAPSPVPPTYHETLACAGHYHCHDDIETNTLIVSILVSAFVFLLVFVLCLMPVVYEEQCIKPIAS